MNILKFGSTGEQVKQLQRKLGLTDDGVFGKMTESKVKEWQKANGLKDDGIVGRLTWGKMFPLELPANNFNLQSLRSVIRDAVLLEIPETAKRFNITTKLRLAHFLAQCAHESNLFSLVYENLNYDAGGLMRVFPSYFPTRELAMQYQWKAELIASRVYGNRMGNGGEATKEGWMYRGRGYIQLTGKNNYRAFDAFVDDDILADPELVAKKYPLMSAAWFFHVNNIWSLCDLGDTPAAVKRVTLAVNGGYNGLDDRQSKFDMFYRLLQ